MNSNPHWRRPLVTGNSKGVTQKQVRQSAPVLWKAVAFAFAACLHSSIAWAYPPAPHHVIYGLVRDEQGNPIRANNARVILETSTGVQIVTTISSNLGAGVNYLLRVPMDARLTGDPYKPTALQPAVPFRIAVKIGQTTYLPIELDGKYAHLGEPAHETRLNLTLGEDSDGDGLPDAWERSLIAALGQSLSLSELRPGDDADHDGLSNMQEYLAGTYAFDPLDGFRLSITGHKGTNPLMQFLAVTGRTYSLLASTDLTNWTSIEFRIPADGADAKPRLAYQASDVHILCVEALITEPQTPQRIYFKAQVR